MNVFMTFFSLLIIPFIMHRIKHLSIKAADLWHRDDQQVLSSHYLTKLIPKITNSNSNSTLSSKKLLDNEQLNDSISRGTNTYY